MENDYSIRINGISKIYKIFDKTDGLLKNILFKSKRAKYKEFAALDNVSFDVIRGETFGIVGANGAGKSTLLKIITGVSTPTKGSVSIKGKVAALLELGAGFNLEFTGIENIYLSGIMLGYTKNEMENRLKSILDFADIGDYANQKVKTYSSGMFARLAFSVAINVEPEVLIVDEALSVGDIYFQNKCYKKFEELRRNGTTVLFVSHDLQSVRQLCSRAIWLDKGKMMLCGDSSEVCNAYTNSILGKNKQNDDKANIVYDNQLLVQESFPPIHYSGESVLNEDVEIVSCFVQDKGFRYVSECIVNEKCTVSVIFKSKREIDNCIVGFVLETKKGLWIINSNTAICDKKGSFSVKANSLNRIDFSFVMPALMRGEYIIGAAVSEGTIESYRVLTWLYNIMAVNIINEGNNSGMIDVDTSISVYSKEGI